MEAEENMVNLDQETLRIKIGFSWWKGAPCFEKLMLHLWVFSPCFIMHSLGERYTISRRSNLRHAYFNIAHHIVTSTGCHSCSTEILCSAYVTQWFMKIKYWKQALLMLCTKPRWHDGCLRFIVSKLWCRIYFSTWLGILKFRVLETDGFEVCELGWEELKTYLIFTVAEVRNSFQTSPSEICY